MARIPNDQIGRIKQEVSLLNLVQTNGHKVTRQGKDYAIQCPFHDDDTPSLIISPKSNLYHCFGCGAAGSVIDWVMKIERCDFRNAVQKLAPNLPVLAAKNEAPVALTHPASATLARPCASKPEPVVTSAEDDQALLNRVVDYYHETLKESPEVLDYLQSRGLNHPELINTFKLGYANRSLGPTLPSRQIKEGALIRGQLEKIGIYRESGHEHFNGSLVVPVINNGVVTEVYGRKIVRNLRKGTPKHLYLPGSHEGVFNLEALQGNDEIILCEALIDALTFWVHGFTNVTTSYGTEGFTPSLLAAFNEHQIKRVMIAYDRDDAGNRAAEALAKQLTGEGIECYRINLPKDMDVNEYALKMTPADKSLGLVIRKATWLGAGDPPQKEVVEQVPEVHEKPEKTEVKQSQAPGVDIEAEDYGHEIHIRLGGEQERRLYRVRGLSKNMNYEQLKVNVLASFGDDVHVDQLDLYNAKARMHFIKLATLELGINENVIKQDLGKVLLKLEALQDQQIKNTLENKAESVELSNQEREEALELLRDPNLMQRVLTDFKRCGVVGEDVNKLTAYLAACSRKLDKPLAVMVQSSSAAGKSSLMDAVLSFIPEEERIQYSAMTGQSLFYMGEQDLKHKILAIAEEEGASNTSYALKLLQSEGEVSIASTGKNATTGNLETQEYKVEGPVMLFSTTTAIDIDEELMNRCLVLSVDESRDQTEAIHSTQRLRRTLDGIKSKRDKNRIKTLHQNAQRLLKPLFIVNPYADQLTFLSDKTRTRRDHEKYLSLIDVVALAHQHQRKIKTEMYEGEAIEYVEVTLKDIALANHLAHEVLGRSLDELPPQTRRLLQITQDFVSSESRKLKVKQSDYRFTRKDVRQVSGWTDFQVKKHLQRLEEMEYLLVHMGGRGKSIVYELLYQGEGNDRDCFLMGLVDVKKLGYDSEKEPLFLNKEPLSSPQKAPKERPSSTKKKPKNTINTVSNENGGKNTEKSTSIEKINGESCRTYTSLKTSSIFEQPEV